MERFTIKRPDGWHVEDWENGIDHHGPAVDRLAAYEDTCLEPEEITAALTSAAKLISTMRNNKKAALWMKKYSEAHHE